MRLHCPAVFFNFFLITPYFSATVWTQFLCGQTVDTVCEHRNIHTVADELYQDLAGAQSR